jgi:restriction system protein
MSIPVYQELMLPVLQAVSDRQEHALSEIRERVAGELGLSEEQLAERYKSDSQNVYSNRVAWAIQYLKSAGTMVSVRRSVYAITDRGATLIQTNPSGITVESLRQFPEFTEFYGRGSNGDDRLEAPSPVCETAETPEESLRRISKIQDDALAENLLETIMNGTPAAFERLVVDLLHAMGYGGMREAACRVVGGSGDMSIDGEVDQDRLGLETVYVQAKRWRGAVTSPELMKFSGGLSKKHAGKGVFITASRFTDDAREYVKALPHKIVLIDGKQLASLMIEHNVG